MGNSFTAPTAAIFMCAVVMASYLIASEPPATDFPSGDANRNFGDAVAAGADVSVPADDTETLRCAFEAGDIDGAYLVDYFAGGIAH